jgi:penicillin amidase
MPRTLWKAIGGLLVIFALAASGLLLYLRRSLPQIDGTLTVTGIHGTVDIIRDADAIPHVFASNKADALFGLGYVHAQDRLWQMEFQRRIGFGRLSEIFGATTIPQDRFLRTVGFGRAARAAWTRTPDWAKEEINAYVAGVNAFIAAHHGSGLPPEFSLLRFEPEPWTGPDVEVWVKMMAWDLSANYSFELLRDDLTRTVGPERTAQLMPPYPRDGLSITGAKHTTLETESHSAAVSLFEPLRGPRSREIDVKSELSPAARSEKSTVAAFTEALSRGDRTVATFLLGNARAEALGSNNWVVDGTRTVSGKPLLANDPHLSAKTPSTWYLAHIVGGDFDVIGATLPGTPAVAIGRNRFIAWGETNVAADVEDLYRERLDPTGTFAEFRGTAERITTVRETIPVKGAAPVQLDVRVTRHGPIVSDAINAINAASPKTPKPAPLDPLAFRWTALDDDDTTLQSFLKLNDARNWDQFTAALRDFVAPSQNFVYADVDGHIGYYAPGRIPLRASGDGSRPADGWTGTAEWTGWVAFDELPHLYDPPDHYIVTANNRPAPADYPYNLGVEWTEPYRAQRIGDLIESRNRLGPDDFVAVQADTLSLHATALRPLLLQHARPLEAADKRALALVSAWNSDARGDQVAPAIFAAWFHELTPALVTDELGSALTETYAGKFSFVARFLARTLAENDARWCDDTRTEKSESCDDTVTAALHSAVTDLARRFGADMSRWRWDGVHHAIFPHQGLDSVGALRTFISRSVPNGGDWSTVNVGPVAADAPYEQHSVAGYRQIVDLSPANDSRFLNDVGESGHPLSRHYDDFLPDWHAVKLRRMRMDRRDVESGAIGHLTLKSEK